MLSLRVMNDLFFYQEIIEEKAKRPKHRGILPHAEVIVQRKDVLANDEFKLMLVLDRDSKNIIQAAKWQGKGCAISRAVMEEISSRLVGVSFRKLQQLKLVDILQPLGLKKITPSRFKCVNIGWQIFQTALSKIETDYLI